jgi:hypothetical protein
MSDTETRWFIKGQEFIHCNCAYGCPCQVNALPTNGHCQAVGGVHIAEGRHGDTDLSGLNIAAVWRWPGAVHEGHGEVVPIVDQRANKKQREALLRIMSGLDTIEGATIFQVFATTYERVYDPVFAPIEFEIDIDARSARLNVPGFIEAHGEPIRNAVTGAETRAQLRLPNGFEYDVAELGRGWAHTEGPITIEIADRHAHFAKLDMTQSGVVH